MLKSGSARLGFQKGNLRRSPATFGRSRLPSRTRGAGPIARPFRFGREVNALLGSVAGSSNSPNGPQLGGSLGLGRLFAPTPSQMLSPYTGGDPAGDSSIFSDAANGI
jgi:hypothetical protein